MATIEILVIATPDRLLLIRRQPGSGSADLRMHAHSDLGAFAARSDEGSIDRARSLYDWIDGAERWLSSAAADTVELFVDAAIPGRIFRRLSRRLGVLSGDAQRRAIRRVRRLDGSRPHSHVLTHKGSGLWVQGSSKEGGADDDDYDDDDA